MTVSSKTNSKYGHESNDVPIAVVGYACRFPDDATSPLGFLKLLAAGRSAWSEVPKNRFNVDSFWHPDTNRIGTTVARGAHWLKEDPKLFDAPFFSMTSAEAAALDPQLRMLLEVVYECFENTGIPIHDVAGTDTSVFVGSSSSEYGHLVTDDVENVPLYAAVGTGVSMLANRLSHFYDLRGPSVALDTAYSSGLMSVANGYARGEGICVLACKRLEYALADGDTIRAVIRATGSNQDGRTPGIVQPNPKAQATLIRETYSTAGIDPQTTAYFEAHGTGTRLGDPLEVSALVESMGTAQRTEDNPLYIGSVKTNIGHLVGCAGLAGLLKAILSVENGFIFPSLNFENPNPRLPLSKWHLKVPQTLTPWPVEGLRRASVNSFGYGGTNAHCIIDDAENYLKLHSLSGHATKVSVTAPAHNDDKQIHDTKDKIGVKGAYEQGSNVETNGVNGHQNGTDKAHYQLPRLFTLSSSEQAAVTRISHSYADYLSSVSTSDLHLVDLAHTLSLRRSTFQWRTNFVANSIGDLQKLMTSPPKATRASSRKENSILFAFTGQGAQHFAMGRELLIQFVFAASVAAADKFIEAELGAEWSVLEEFQKSEGKSRINSAKFSQPLCTVLQVALVDLFRSWDIQPAAVIGHSSGEIAAAYAANFLSAQDAWRIAYYRGLLSDKISTKVPELDGEMGMMAVGLSEDETKKYLQRYSETHVSIACCNSPSSVTLSGNQTALADLESVFKADQVFARRLAVEVAYHSPYMKAISGDYAQSLQNIRPLTSESPSGTVMISTVKSAPIQATDLGPEYWVQNMVSPVRFVQGMEYIFPLRKNTKRRQRVAGLNIDTILEFGPHSALQGPIRQALTNLGYVEEVTYHSVQVRDQDAQVTALEAVGSLWNQGFKVDFDAINNPYKMEAPRTLGGLPSYPWNHSTSFWFETTADHKRLRPSPRKDLIGIPTNQAVEWKWRNILRTKENPWLLDYQINGDAHTSPASMIVAAVEASRHVLQSRGDAAVERVVGFNISDVVFHDSIQLNEEGQEIYTELLPAGRVSENRDAIARFQFHIFTVVDNEPMTACSGFLSLEQDHRQQISTTPSNTTTGENIEVPPQLFYNNWGLKGLLWGSQFQLFQHLTVGAGSSEATLQLKDTKALMPAQFGYDHLLHPTALGACFQTAFASLPETTSRCSLHGIKSLLVPTNFGRVPGTQIRASGPSKYLGFGSYESDVVAIQDTTESASITAQGLQIRYSDADIDQVAKKKPVRDVKKTTSNFYWKPDVDKLSASDVKTIFALDNLVLTRPSSRSHSDARERALARKHLQSVPDVVPWRALCAKWLELLGHKEPDQTILEVAESTDDFLGKAMDVLGGRDDGATPLCTKCICSLPPNSNSSADSWSPWRRFLDCGNFNMFDAAASNHPELATVDIIVVSAVLVSKSLKVLLKNCYTALRPGGRLIVCRTHAKTSDKKLQHQLNDVGFSDSLTWLPHGTYPDVSTMVVAKKPSTPTLSVKNAIIALPDETTSDVAEFVSSIQRRLEEYKVNVKIQQWSEIADSVEGSAVISLLEVNQPLIYDMDAELFYKIQRFFSNNSKGGIWMIRGNMHIDPSGDPRHHASSGLLRCMRNEKHESKFTELALDHTLPLNRKTAVDLVIESFRDVFESDSLDKTAETEIAENHGIPYIARLYDEPLKNRKLDLNGKLPPPELSPIKNDSSPRRLDIGNPKNISSLRFIHNGTTYPAELLPDDVVVDLQAHGVRSLDSLIYDFGLAEDKLGVDAAGVVVDVGAEVSRFKRGDLVAVFTSGVYVTKITVNQDFVAKIPNGLNILDAATLPSLTLVAHHIIFNVCRLSERDSILIGDAESSLGIVLIQVANAAKASVFAMVADAKAATTLIDYHLLPATQIFFSADGLLGKTTQTQLEIHYIDFVIYGKDSKHILSSALSHDHNKPGRAIALDYQTLPDNIGPLLNGRLDSSHSLMSIPEISRTIYSNPEYVRRLVQLSRDNFESGSITCETSCTSFSYSDMKSAFDLAKRRPRDRIALQLGPNDVVPTVPRSAPSLQCDPSATYLVLGGFGGLGRWLLEKLASHGAKNLATFSRSGASTAEAKDCVAALEKKGVKLSSYKCDVTDPKAFRSALDTLESEMPKIRGAIHATMVLHDEYLADLTSEKWSAACRNKIQGGLNMHEMLPKALDFFVLISSASAIMGNGMQSNYATGNAFLDGLALHRRHLGLAAASVNFGVITEIGFVAERVTFDSTHIADFTLNSISPREVWDCLESGMTGFLHLDEPMPAHLVTCSGSGGIFEQLKHIKTFLHMSDPKYKYIIRLDASGSEDSYSKIRQGRKELSRQLEVAASLNEALDIVETALVEKVAAAIPMSPTDVDPSRPVSEYGINSLLANEIRNWAFSDVKGTISAAEILSMQSISLLAERLTHRSQLVLEKVKGGQAE